MNNHQRCGLAGLLLITSVVAFPSAHAEMVSTGQAPSAGKTSVDREKVQAFTDRKDVQDKLQAQGVSAEAAKARVDALTDSEVAAIASRADALPAGGNLSQMDMVLVLLIAILVAIAL